MAALAQQLIGVDMSIVICSYNRAHNLPECFDCLLAQERVDDIAWEVVLVDNNSKDDTKRVALRYAQASGIAQEADALGPDLAPNSEIPAGKLNLRYCFEGEQGLSYARNKGIEEGKGKVVVFIDDDIRVTPLWLRTIYDTFQTHDCDAVGGRIHVQSPEQFPKWLTPDLYGFLGHQDFGDEPHAMDGYREFPFGGNMAIHRRAFDQIGVFDTRLGRKGEGRRKEELFKGEETDFFHRLADAGGRFRYHPDMLVLHKILPHQLEKRFFLTLHRNAGILAAGKDTSEHQRRLFGIPLFLFPQYLRAVGRYLYSIATKGPNLSVRKRMNVAYFSGMIAGYLLLEKSTD